MIPRAFPAEKKGLYPCNFRGGRHGTTNEDEPPPSIIPFQKTVPIAKLLVTHEKKKKIRLDTLL